MKVRLALVAAPWANPLRPSIQLGALKAWLVNDLGSQAEIKYFPAHLSIPVEGAGGEFVEWYYKYYKHEETSYLLAWLARYGLPGVDNPEPTLERALAAVNEKSTRILTRACIDELAEATIQYVEDVLVPWLRADAVNVIGLTLNFDQVLASAFVIRALADAAPTVPIHPLFGGMSVVQARTVAIMKRLGVSGHAVLGEGELKLSKIVRACLDLPEGSSREDVTSAIEGADPGVYSLDDPPELYRYERSRYASELDSLSALPIPDYDDYYDELRVLCDSERVYQRLVMETTVMAEGTRGCFAKCDFCSFNLMWTGFRRLESAEIAERTQALIDRYNPGHLAFADNVCDTWAEGYAEEFITRSLTVPTFMEMRAHHPEPFWTQLHLAGIDGIQVGVEAVSGPLLRGMAKGTQVIQNLRAEKYLAELGVRSAANLITHHPKSTLDDIAETRRVVESFLHLKRFNLCRFAVAVGSPIYADLDPDEKRTLDLGAWHEHLPAEIRPWQVDWRFSLPPSLSLSEEVERGWDEFTSWYEELCERADERGPSMTVRSLGNAAIVEDSRTDQPRTIVLHGDAAAVLDAAHRGLARERLAGQLGWSIARVEAALAELCDDRLVLIADGHVLALPLRPADVLVRNLLRARAARAGRVRLRTA